VLFGGFVSCNVLPISGTSESSQVCPLEQGECQIKMDSCMINFDAIDSHTADAYAAVE
jgi:hypothetical protein